MSVDQWVEILRQGDNNPIIYYKPREELSDDGLQPEEFLLCVQTPFQREQMRQFAHKIVCIDSTHGTTQYDFVLTTVVVVNQRHEHM